MKTFNVSLVGVGGQGIILTADMLAKAAALAGYQVKKSEIHGMSQRGGSVTSQVRFGDNVASPIIQEGTADVLVSFDKLEALRSAGILAKGGTAKEYFEFLEERQDQERDFRNRAIDSVIRAPASLRDRARLNVNLRLRQMGLAEIGE